jgi:hypothetical protein
MENQLEGYNEATNCCLCNCIFAINNPKFHDHEHYTGKYRGAACSNCNLKYKQPKFILVVFHKFIRLSSIC